MKSKETMVKEVIGLQKDMNALSVEKINEMAPAPTETACTELSIKEKAAAEGCMYITPKRQLKAFGTLPEKLKKQHAYDWEYVKGMYKNEIISTEPKTFWFSKYPGDPDCLWEIPANRPVYVPRMVAVHLSGEKESLTGIQTQVYHTFNFIQKPEGRVAQDDFTHEFAPTATHYRGKFNPIGAFA